MEFQDSSPVTESMDGRVKGPEALEEAFENASRLAHFISAYAGLALEEKKVSAKNSLIRMAAAFSLFMAATVVSLVSLVFTLLGIALGIGNLAAPGHPYSLWAGYLITGLGSFILLGGGAGYALNRWKRNALKKRMERYE